MKDTRFLAFVTAILLAGCTRTAAVATDPPHAAEGAAPGSPPLVEPAEASPAPSDPVPTDAEVETAGIKLVRVFESLGDAIAANANDCAAMATGIQKVTADSRDTLQESRKWRSNPAAQAKMSEWLAKQGAMEIMQRKMMEGMTKCGQDPNVMSAITGMMDSD